MLYVVKSLETIQKEAFLSQLQLKTNKNWKAFINQNKSFIKSNDIDFGDLNEVLDHPWYQQADVVHLHNLHGNYFPLNIISQMSQEKKIVWTLHDMWAITGHCVHSLDCKKWRGGCGDCPYLKTPQPYLFDRTKEILKKKSNIYKKSNLNIVVPSRWVEEKVRKSVLKNQKITLIPNGIDTKNFSLKNEQSKKTLREKMKLPQDKTIFISVGHAIELNPWKGGVFLKELFTEFKDRKDILFLVIGVQTEKAFFDFSNVKTFGYLGVKELTKYLHCADALIFPSIAESASLVVQEAMSCGLPVIGFDVADLKKEVKHKKTGYVCKEKNTHELKRGIGWFFALKKKKRRTISSQLNREVKKKRSFEVMFEDYLKIYGF